MLGKAGGSFFGGMGGRGEERTVEEFVRHKIYGAVYVFFDAEEEFEWAAGFVADGEGYVLEVAGCVCDLFLLWSVFPFSSGMMAAAWVWLETYMFTCFSGEESISVRSVVLCLRQKVTYMVRFRQLTGIGSPGLYPRCSSRVPSGSWPLNAVASVLKKEKRATAGSQGLLDNLSGILLSFFAGS